MLAVGITPLSSNRVRMNQTSTPKYTETRPSKNTQCHPPKPSYSRLHLEFHQYKHVLRSYNDHNLPRFFKRT